MLFSSCPLVLPPQHYSFSFQKIIPFSPSSKTTYAPLEEESTQRARGAALGTRGPRGRKGSETDDMSFLRRAVAKGARHAAMRVQKTTTTTTAHTLEQQQQQRHRKQQPEDFLLLLRRRRRRRLRQERTERRGWQKM